MRILLTADPELPIPPTFYGGIERIVDLIASGMGALGHEVGLVAHPDSSSLVEHLFTWPGLRSQNVADCVLNTIALQRAVHRFKPHLLHSFSRMLYMLPLLGSSLPKVMSYQRQPGSRQVAGGSKIAGKSLAFTGCSEHICRRGRRAGGTWHAIHNCIDLDKYTFRSEVAADAPLVFLSRIERIKGAHTAITVAKRTGRRLLIAGNHGTFGEEGRYWSERIVPHLDRDRVEYIGEVNDLQKNDLLGQAAALIVPIEWDEPFGLVFAEALACGTPVISCPRGAVPEIVRDSVDGYLVEDLDDACNAVLHISSIDRYECRRRVEKCFSNKTIVSKYEQLYKQSVLREL